MLWKISEFVYNIAVICYDGIQLIVLYVCECNTNHILLSVRKNEQKIMCVLTIEMHL